MLARVKYKSCEILGYFRSIEIQIQKLIFSFFLFGLNKPLYRHGEPLLACTRTPLTYPSRLLLCADSSSQLPLSLLKTAEGHPMVSSLLSLMSLSVRGLPRLFSSRLPSPPLIPCFINLRPLPQLVELKNGETYNGTLVSCDSFMNMSIREVFCTSKVRFVQ